MLDAIWVQTEAVRFLFVSNLENGEVIAAAKHYFANFKKTYFAGGIKKVEYR